MSKIRTISSEFDLIKDSIKHFKYNLAFEQKEFYFDKGVENYYGSIPENQLESETKSQKIMYKFLEKNFLEKNKEITFISLGCGNGDIEKAILNKATKNKYQVEYFGVDSSMNMIERAQKNLQNSKFKSQFIYSDFSDEKFKETFNSLIKINKKKIFAFFGGTIGNVPQNYIANTLRNMLNKGDILWIDVSLQIDDSNSTANYWFKRILKFLDSKERIDFLKYPLKKLNIPVSSGKITLDMEKEKSLNTLLFKFLFQIEKDIEFEINNEPMTLLKGDYINLINIRVYEFESLKKFFEARGFKTVDYFKFNEDTLQIAFEKQ